MEPDESSRRVLSERIPAATPESIAEALGHDLPRAKMKAVVEEYVKNVDFEDLVMKYAGKEIDKRQLGTFRFWSVTILVAFTTAIVTALVTIALTHAGTR